MFIYTLFKESSLVEVLNLIRGKDSTFGKKNIIKTINDATKVTKNPNKIKNYIMQIKNIFCI